MTKLDAAFDSPQSKRRYVRTLFATIADRYDLVTAVLSYGQDAKWKQKLVTIADVVSGERALDLAAGTGDIAFAVAARGARTIGLDITHRMLQLARLRASGASAGQARDRACGVSVGPADDRAFGASSQQAFEIPWINGDMISLPFRSSSFDLVTTGYGLRNVPDLAAAVTEIARVLRPGGRLLSLDFNKPENAIVRAIYLSYLTIAGSTLGWILHRDPDTYRYIAASIRRHPGARGVADLLAAHGFDHVAVIPLLFGLMSIHIAERSQERHAGAR